MRRLRIGKKQSSLSIPVCRHLVERVFESGCQWLGIGRPSEGFACAWDEGQALLVPPPRSYVARLTASVRSDLELPEGQARKFPGPADHHGRVGWGAEVVERLLSPPDF